MNKQEKNAPQPYVVGVVSKTIEDGKTKIELRSGEVQELMGRPPSAILKSGITIILILVVSFFVSSLFLVYPEQMTVTAKLFPSMDIEYMDSPFDGHLVWVTDSMNTDVAEGDTLAMIVRHPADTICLVCHVEGHAYKADFMEKNMTIVAGQRLFCVSKTDNADQKHNVNGVIYLPYDSSSVLKLGQIANVNYKGASFPFVIAEFGKIANEEGKQPIRITYIDSLNYFNNIEPEICVAVIQKSTQTIFEKFFAKRLNILNNYKINN